MNRAQIPSLSGLRYFYSVAKSGSFSVAAGILSVAPSAINRQVAALEDRVGHRLFDRSRGRGGLQLTEAGRALYRRLTTVMNELSIADEELNALRGLQQGHLRLSVNEVVATELLPRILQQILAHYPNITFQIAVQNSPVLLQRLRASEIDVALGFNIAHQPGIRLHEVINHDTYVVSAASDELATRTRLDLSDLAGRRLILPESSMALRRTIDAAAAQSGLSFQPFIETDNFTLLRKLVAIGAGISMVVGRLSQVANDGLAYIKLDNPAFRLGTLSCCTLEGRTVSGASRIFIDTARDAMMEAE